MKTRLFTLAILLYSFTFFISCDEVNEIIDDLDVPLTEEEVVLGLKEALSIGLDTSVDDASTVDGYLQNEIIKVLLPEDVLAFQSAINNDALVSTAYQVYISSVNGGEDIFDELLVAMNRGAEGAASKAGPIFGDALTNMSIADAFTILEGDSTAATAYFAETTTSDLVAAFAPEVKDALDGTGALDLFALVSGFVNYEIDYLVSTATVGELIDVSVPENIEEYTTEKAVDGLFYLVGEEEKNIRRDPFAWGSDIIERVFGN